MPFLIRSLGRWGRTGVGWDKWNDEEAVRSFMVFRPHPPNQTKNHPFTTSRTSFSVVHAAHQNFAVIPPRSAPHEDHRNVMFWPALPLLLRPIWYRSQVSMDNLLHTEGHVVLGRADTNAIMHPRLGEEVLVRGLLRLLPPPRQRRRIQRVRNKPRSLFQMSIWTCRGYPHALLPGRNAENSSPPSWISIYTRAST